MPCGWLGLKSGARNGEGATACKGRKRRNDAIIAADPVAPLAAPRMAEPSTVTDAHPRLVLSHALQAAEAPLDQRVSFAVPPLAGTEARWTEGARGSSVT